MRQTANSETGAADSREGRGDHLFTYGADGQVVKEESRQIAPNGAATTEFHVSKPDGWPEGEYKVEVSLNGTPSGTKSFEVRKG